MKIFGFDSWKFWPPCIRVLDTIQKRSLVPWFVVVHRKKEPSFWPKLGIFSSTHNGSSSVWTFCISPLIFSHVSSKSQVSPTYRAEISCYNGILFSRKIFISFQFENSFAFFPRASMCWEERHKIRKLQNVTRFGPIDVLRPESLGISSLCNQYVLSSPHWPQKQQEQQLGLTLRCIVFSSVGNQSPHVISRALFSIQVVGVCMQLTAGNGASKTLVQAGAVAEGTYIVVRVAVARVIYLSLFFALESTSGFILTYCGRNRGVQTFFRIVLWRKVVMCGKTETGTPFHFGIMQRGAKKPETTWRRINRKTRRIIVGLIVRLRAKNLPFEPAQMQ